MIVPALIISGLSGVLTGRLTDVLPPPLVVLTMMLALAVIFYSFAAVTALTASAVIVTHVILYRICMMGGTTPLTVLIVQQLGVDQVRMAQGLLGVVRSIGGVLGVTLTSVFFERRRIWHQLTAYEAYNTASVEHYEIVSELQLFLHKAGMLGASADQRALGTIRRQIDIAALASGFQDSFVLICTCFLLGSLPMVYFYCRYGWARR